MSETLIDGNLHWAAIILAAGNSVRMNHHKALLRFNAKQTFIQKIVSEYTDAGCNHIIIVANKNNSEPISSQFAHSQNPVPEIILNQHPEYERFYSMKLGLGACRHYPICFIQHCDNPFITSHLLKEMVKVSLPDNFVVPCYMGKKGHPVLLGSKIMDELYSCEGYYFTLKDFLSKFECVEFDTSGNEILYNINTKEDYRRFFPV